MSVRRTFFSSILTILLSSNIFAIQGDLNYSTTPRNGKVPQLNTQIPADQLRAEDLELLRNSNNHSEVPNRDDAVGGNWLFLRSDNGWGGMDWMFNNAGLDNWDAMTDPNDLSSVDLYQYDVIWIKDYQSDAFNAAYNNNRSYVDQWVADGGTLYSCDGTNNWGVAQIHPGGLTRINFYDWDSYTTPAAGECSMFDDIGWGPNTVLTGSYHAHAGYNAGDIASASNGDWQKLVTGDANGNGTIVTARYGFGDGQVVVSGSTDGAGFNWGFTWGGVQHSIFHYLYGLSNVAPPAAPNIVVTPASLDFGSVLVGSSSDLDITISNDGDADLQVSNVSVTGTGFSVAFGGSFTVTPNGSQNVTVSFTPNGFGSFAGQVTVESDDADQGSVTVDLSGTGIGPIITVDPASLNFGNVEFRRSSSLSFEVCNEGTAAGTVDDISVSGADFESDFSGSFTLNPGECQTVTVTFTANAVGAASGSVEVASDDPFNATSEVSLSGNGVWVPSSVLLGRLCQSVDALRNAGFLNRGQANSLCVKTENAIRALARQQPRVALNVLNAFVNEVRAFISSGVLSAANGQPLIDEAIFISDLIREFGVASDSGFALGTVEIPTEVALLEGYPNPFNAMTNIRFAMPEAGRVELALFDLTGREVSRLVSGEVQVGFHNVTVNGENLQAGMYIVRLSALGQTEVSRITYIR